MPANAALYLPQPAVDLGRVFDGVKSDKTLFRKASWYDVPLATNACVVVEIQSSRRGAPTCPLP